MDIFSIQSIRRACADGKATGTKRKGGRQGRASAEKAAKRRRMVGGILKTVGTAAPGQQCTQCGTQVCPPCLMPGSQLGNSVPVCAVWQGEGKEASSCRVVWRSPVQTLRAITAASTLPHLLLVRRSATWHEEPC